jgi:hypothetical protein
LNKGTNPSTQIPRDFATWEALFLEDAVVNPPDEPAVKGRAALTEFSDRPRSFGLR